jgi:hypothetical protein
MGGDSVSNPLASTTSIDTSGEFAQALRAHILDRRPQRILETGTYHGTGTTAVIGRTILEAGYRPSVISVECNPENYEKAVVNCRDFPVRILHGLSIPRSWLPTPAEIDDKVQAFRRDFPGSFVDHESWERAERYFQESLPCPLDDVIGFIGHPADMVVLDGAGHLGDLEFKRAMEVADHPFALFLDDTEHFKHKRTVEEKIRPDPKWHIVAEGCERYGWLQAELAG